MPACKFSFSVADPPGPIDNKRISALKNGQLCVRQNSDHGQLSGEMWNFLFDIYGGGPELIIKQVAPQPTLAAQAKTLAEQALSARANRTENAQSPSTESVPETQKVEQTETASEQQDENTEKETATEQSVEEPMN